MKTYEEMAKSALERIDQYKIEQNKRIKRIIKITAPAFGFCLAAVLGFGAWQSGLFKVNSPSVDLSGSELAKNNYSVSSIEPDTSEEMPEQDDSNTEREVVEHNAQSNLENKNGENSEAEHNIVKEVPEIITSSEDGQKGVGVGTIDGCCLFIWKNKLSMGGTLYWTLEDNPDGVFSVLATYRPITANITSFVYEGKTLAEWAIEANNEKMLPEKMKELLKSGDDLKYGTALYETGTPSGEKWDKRFYEERIAYFGKELLGKYIVDGIFLSDELEKDIEEYNENSAAKGYKLAYNAYLETVIPKTIKLLSENNIKCKRADYLNSGIALTVTAEELENLPLEDIENWSFDLNSGDLKSAPTVTTADDGIQVWN